MKTTIPTAQVAKKQLGEATQTRATTEEELHAAEGALSETQATLAADTKCAAGGEANHQKANSIRRKSTPPMDSGLCCAAKAALAHSDHEVFVAGCRASPVDRRSGDRTFSPRGTYLWP